MINLDLLPEVLRKKERLPLPQFLGLCGGLAVFGLIGYLVVHYLFFVIPDLNQRRAALQRQKQDLQGKADEGKRINQEIARLGDYIGTVKTLYRNRVVWAKILSDIKSIVNFDPEMNVANPEMRHLWFTKLTGKAKDISISGYATSSSRETSLQMQENLIQGFISYSPRVMPEKGEEERLQEQLRRAIAVHESRRVDDPTLPARGPEEEAIRRRLEEIAGLKSGGIALLPFSNLLVPGSIQLINSTSVRAPRPRGVPDHLLSMFPTEAWSFGIGMKLK
ncbi:MAG: hypothetical protein LBU64_13280 [Planctomycetota bacterium]|jgi:Tfp pilus assembly protein PilN|nr:hypothetical protein [Planctomycetota bacterium]